MSARFRALSVRFEPRHALTPAPFAFSFQVRYASVITGAHADLRTSYVHPIAIRYSLSPEGRRRTMGLHSRTFLSWESNPKDYLLVLHRPKGPKGPIVQRVPRVPSHLVKERVRVRVRLKDKKGGRKISM